MHPAGPPPGEFGRPHDVEIRVLGPVEADRDGSTVNLGGPKQRAIFALLVSAAGDRCSTGFLLEEVYGDKASPGARRSVQTYVSNLRRELGDAIVPDRRGYRLSVPAAHIDAMRFDELRTRASDAIDTDPMEAAKLLREALGQWRGHPFADVEARGALTTEIARLSEARLDAIELRIDAELELGRHLQLISELESLTIEYPLRERFRAQHMLALYRAGRQGDALRAFAKTRTHLAEELGIEPSEELQALELKILDQDDSLIGSSTSVIERVAVLAAEHLSTGANPNEREVAAAWRDRVFTNQVSLHGGGSIDVRHTTVYASFPTVDQALRAASELPIGEFRIAVDHGAVDLADQTISGPPVSRALRLAAIAHPGQVLVSEDAQRSLAESGARGWMLSMLGRFQIHGVKDRIQLFQLAGEGHAEHPPLLIDRLPPPLRQATPGFAAGYELREELGEGLSGAVYRAYQSSIGREVAVRVVRRDLVGDLRFIRRFESEMQRIIDLSHPSIVPLIDFWREPSAAFIVARLMTLPSLSEARLDDRLGIRRVFDGVAEAVAYGHAAGTVHGRIRPHNILIGEGGQPVLLDFGLSSLFGDLIRYPVDAYTAPEVIDGEATVAADVYALAVLSAELLSGSAIPLDGPLPTIDPAFDEAIARATASDPGERHPDVASFMSDLRSSPSGAIIGRHQIRNPFKGLSAFTESDANDFYGRQELVGRLTDAVERNPFTVVVGSSGIGKSSVVLAGLVPAVRAKNDLLVATMRPGHRPFEALTDALTPVAVSPPHGPIADVESFALTLEDALAAVLPKRSRLLLIIDQMEELFTLASAHDRTAFLASLTESMSRPQSRLTVVATMRADYYDRPLEHPVLGKLVADNTIAVHAPRSHEWRSIITAPAESVGVEVDDTLVDAIIADVDSSPGSLPLVEHALRQMFANRDDDRLNLDEYARSGGLAGSIDRTAERVYRALSEDDRGIARRVFTRLVTVNEETEDARRTARQSDLDRAGLRWSVVQEAMAGFVQHRLVVTGRDPATRQPTIEVAHEALIHHWGRLASWIDEARADLLLGRGIERSSADWIDADRSDEFLFRGARLEQAEGWAHSHPTFVGPTEEAFLEESRRVADGEVEAVRRRRRRTVVALSAALAVSATLAVFAWTLRGVAETRAVENQVLRLTRDAELALADDPQLATLLALEAFDRLDGLDDRIRGEVATALQVTSQASRLVGVIPHGRSFAEASPDGRLLVVDAGDGTNGVVVYDQATLRAVTRFDAGAAPAHATFSPDASTLAVVVQSPGDDNEPTVEASAIRLYATDTFDLIGVFDDRCCLMDPQFSPDGTWLKTDNLEEQSVVLRNLDGGTRQVWPTHSLAPARWMPEGHTLVLASPDGTALDELDASTGERRSLLHLPISEIDWIAVHPSGRSVVTSGESIQMWRIGEVRPEWTVEEAALIETEFSPDGRMVAAYGGSEQILVVPTLDGDPIRLRGHWGGVRGVSFSDRGDHLFALDSSGVKVWDLAPEGQPLLGNLAVGGVSGRTLFWASSDGHRLSVVESSGTSEQIAIHDVSEGRLLARSIEFLPQWGPVASHSGRFAGGLLDGSTGAIQDVDTGELVYVRECRTPLAIADDGRHAALLDTCNLDDDTHVFLTELETDTELTRWVGVTPTIGPDATPSEGLIAYAPPPFTEVHILSLEDGAPIASLVHGVDDARFPRFSPDGRYLSFGSKTGGGLVVDIERFVAGATLEESLVLRAVVETGVTPTAVASGEFAATTHSGDVVRLWDIESGLVWATIPLGSGTQSDAIITADSRFLYYQDRPGVVARMPLRLEDLANLARAGVFRGFTAAECVRYEIGAGCPLSSS